MQEYLDLLQDVLENGTRKEDRTGTGTISVFGRQMRFNLRAGFPIVTTKKVHFKSVVHELLWFISGDTNVKYLQENGVRIWDEWSDENGDLGPVYGKQWRKWTHVKYFKGNLIPSQYEGWKLENCHPKADVRIRSIDQLQKAIDLIKNNPKSRRIIVNAWNPAELEEMALTPCHSFFQFHCRPISSERRYHEYVQKTGMNASDAESMMEISERCDRAGIPAYYLDCQMYQRSVDTFLGLPFNIASYSLLTHMVAQVTNTIPGEFVWTGGDVHIYTNHLKQVETQLQRSPKALPKLVLNPDIKNIDDFKFEDISIDGYEYDSAIKAPIAV